VRASGAAGSEARQRCQTQGPPDARAAPDAVIVPRRERAPRRVVSGRGRLGAIRRSSVIADLLHLAKPGFEGLLLLRLEILDEPMSRVASALLLDLGDLLLDLQAELLQVDPHSCSCVSIRARPASDDDHSGRVWHVAAVSAPGIVGLRVLRSRSMLHVASRLPSSRGEAAATGGVPADPMAPSSAHRRERSHPAVWSTGRGHRNCIMRARAPTERRPRTPSRTGSWGIRNRGSSG
jgi:hypothetical protein